MALFEVLQALNESECAAFACKDTMAYFSRRIAEWQNPQARVVNTGDIRQGLNLHMMHADGRVRLKCTPECEARVFRDTYKISTEAFRGLNRLVCPVAVAAGTEDVTAAIEAEAPLITAQIPGGRFEK